MSDVGDFYGETGKFALEFKRAIAHGTFNGAMRLAQGGKFEHGFLSGFVSSLGGSYLSTNGFNMSGAEKIAISAAIGGTAEALGGGKFANGAVTGAYVMALNHLGHQGDKKGKEKRIAATVGSKSNFPIIDGQIGPWSNEYIFEKTLEYVSDPTVGFIAYIFDDVLMFSKGMGHMWTTLSVGNDTYHYLIKEDIGTGRYLFRLSGAVVGTTLSVIGSSAAPFVGPTFVFYEKAFDFIITTYENIDNRLNSKQWWGWHYGF